MMGLGVDDMFVVCNALDQVSLNLTPKERLMKALRHSGPSITVTSLTDALAFLSGVTSNIPAIQAFCVYCSLTVFLLYLSVLTIFLAYLYWDSVRVYEKRREFGGCIFRCKDNSRFFCRSTAHTKD